MSSLARLMIAFVLLIAPDAARAHAPVFGLSGFFGGMLHPMFVPLHALTILGIGLLIGGQARRRVMALSFVIGAAAGSLAIAGAYAPSFTGEALLSLAMVAGALVALAIPVPGLFVGGLAAAAGLTIALDSPPETISIREAILMQLGTFLAASLFLMAIVAGTLRLTRHWERIGTRIVGSWIAASAILVLALRLAR